jgi:hypothetical protein
MDMSQQDEKLQLEHEAARVFMRLYQQRFGQKMQHIWHNQPAKPDVSCYLNQVRLDLEIAHLYGSEVEAMAILGRVLSNQTLLALQQLAELPAEERMIGALHRIISQKANKSYESERVWLVIRNANPRWNCVDIERHREALQIPAVHPFEQIWLVGDWHGDSGILPLFPTALRNSFGTN